MMHFYFETGIKKSILLDQTQPILEKK